MKTLLVAMLLITVPVLALAPTAEAKPECSDIHNKWVLGPLTIVQQSSCDYQVYVDGQPVLP